MTCSYAKEFSSSSFTDVENVFIYEYMPLASGDAVKVYLYGLFLCQHPEHDQNIDVIAKTLNLSSEKIVESFRIWEEFGLVSVLTEEPLSVQYLPVRMAFTGKARKYKPEKYGDFTKSLQALLPSRMISTGEFTEYFNVMETYGIKPDAMLLIIHYCVDRKGQDIGYRYISKVAKDFGLRGLVTVEKVEKELESYVLRTGHLVKIISALGLKRQPEIEDANLYKVWTQELNFDPESIQFVASKLKRGNFEKLDKAIKELYSVKCFSAEEIEGYFGKKNAVYDLAIKINRALSIYVDVLEPVIETYLNKWISYGYEEDALLFIAHRAFKTGKNTLEDMDAQIEYLNAHGFIGLSSVSDYFDSLKKTDEFIAKMLMTAGINRRPNSWDRDNLATWKNWNFSEEMILEAAKLSAGKSSPIAYMNGILGNWKNNGVFDTETANAPTTTVTAEEYNREYERRRRFAISTAEDNVQKAMEIEGFSKVYARLNELERDLAIAEISGDETLLKKYENEQTELLKKQSELLKTIGLTTLDLSPKFNCDKCSDTGYIGSDRCDCFEKGLK